MSGQAVQLVGGRETRIEAGDPTAWCDRFAAVGEVAVVDLDAALGRGDNAQVIQALLGRARVRLGGGIRTRERAIEWLRAGAEKVVIGTAASRDLLSRLPRDRVVVALDAVDGEVVTHGWRTATGASVEDRMRELGDLVDGYLVTLVEREGRLVGTDLERAERLRDAAGRARLTIAGGIHTAEEIATLDRLGIDAQVGMALYDGSLDLVDAFTAPLRSDRPDGLWPTVVADLHGRALGLVYSNRESVAEAVRTRSGVYWSRTRGLWRKGETSGATQELVRIDPDCDRDALRFTVRQGEPGFCHLERASCWGPLGGLPALEARVEARREGGGKKSYTATLLADPDALRTKLLEEAEELSEARDPDHVVWEAADLVYFSTVALARSGATWDQVSAELDRRAGVAGAATDGTSSNGAASPDVVQTPPSVPDARVLPVVGEEELLARGLRPFSAEVLSEARAIVAAVRKDGVSAVRRFGARFGDPEPGVDLVVRRDDIERRASGLPSEVRALLERTATRIREFAERQYYALTDLSAAVPGGRAGHRWIPLRSAGCYVPGGRFPLPSSLLMGAIPARVAGVERVVVATPSLSPVMAAAASIAQVDAVLCAGGAQAIAALAYGIRELPPVDLVAGPGNAWVTAAKYLVSDHVGVDMLAGPSEVLIVASGDANPAWIAADLIAQAEHDPMARPILIALDGDTINAVERELRAQLEELPTAEVARQSLERNGKAVFCPDLDRVQRLCDRLAPEHLQLSGGRARALAGRLSAYGSLFIGERSAEVFGDYGAGPNHILPTGGSARHRSGLGVYTFLCRRTWLEADDPAPLISDAAALARIEGLEGHARAAEARLPG